MTPRSRLSGTCGGRRGGTRGPQVGNDGPGPGTGGRETGVGGEGGAREAPRERLRGPSGDEVGRGHTRRPAGPPTDPSTSNPAPSPGRPGCRTRVAELREHRRLEYGLLHHLLFWFRYLDVRQNRLEGAGASGGDVTATRQSWVFGGEGCGGEGRGGEGSGAGRGVHGG